VSIKTKTATVRRSPAEVKTTWTSHVGTATVHVYVYQGKLCLHVDAGADTVVVCGARNIEPSCLEAIRKG
jgi:quercetin dioxygenase-like cupin family protein